MSSGQLTVGDSIQSCISVPSHHCHLSLLCTLSFIKYVSYHTWHAQPAVLTFVLRGYRSRKSSLHHLCSRRWGHKSPSSLSLLSTFPFHVVDISRTATHLLRHSLPCTLHVYDGLLHHRVRRSVQHRPRVRRELRLRQPG